MALVHMPPSEVIPLHVLPIPTLRQPIDINLIKWRLEVLLSLSQCVLKVNATIVKLFTVHTYSRLV